MSKYTDRQDLPTNESDDPSSGRRIPLSPKGFITGLQGRGLSPNSLALTPFSPASQHTDSSFEVVPGASDFTSKPQDVALALNRLTPSARTLLNVLSFLDPEHIHEEILIAGMDLKAHNYPPTKAAYHITLKELLQSSIVHRNDADGDLWIRQLVQEVARDMLRNTPYVLQESFDLGVSLISAIWPFIVIGTVGRAHKVGRWAKCARLYEHISHLRRVWMEVRESVPCFKASVDFAYLLTEAGWYQYERGNVIEADPLLDAAEQICGSSNEDIRKTLSFIHGAHQCVASIVNNAGKCLHHAQARLNLEQELQIDTGNINAELASAYNDLGSALTRNELYAEAIPMLLRSKELRESLPTFRPYNNYSPLYELGLVHWLQGKYVESSRYLLQALEDREQALGRDDTESRRTGTLLFALGNVFVALGRQDDSFTYHQRALAQYRSTVGDTHSATADACYKVAGHYARVQEYDEARTLLEQALQIYRDRSYLEPHIARTRFRLAGILSSLGKTNEANEHEKLALDIHKKMAPEYDGVDPPTEADFDRFVAYESR